MIVFRHADRRFPFLWETADQPAARWHGAGDGPVQYLAETPDGAWAEFLRHEGITDTADLGGVARSLWAVELTDPPRTRPTMPVSIITGGESTWVACQAEARRLRGRGAAGIIARSAAIVGATPSGFRTAGGLRPGRLREERVFVLFGPRPDLIGWRACDAGRPGVDLLARVRPLEA